LTYSATHSANWLRESASNVPSEFQSALNGSSTNPNNSGSFGDAMGFLAEHDKSVVALVLTLLCLTSPSHIPRLIISIQIWVTVQAMLWRWFLANVGKKGCKAVAPLIANRDTPPTVVWIMLVRFLQASHFYGRPCCIFW